VTAVAVQRLGRRLDVLRLRGAVIDRQANRAGGAVDS
jgi:hypothetical protein